MLYEILLNCLHPLLSAIIHGYQSILPLGALNITFHCFLPTNTEDNHWEQSLARYFLYNYFARNLTSILWWSVLASPICVLILALGPSPWPAPKPPWRYQQSFPSNWMVLSHTMITPWWAHLMRNGINPTTRPDCRPATIVHPCTLPPFRLSDVEHIFRSSQSFPESDVPWESPAPMDPPPDSPGDPWSFDDSSCPPSLSGLFKIHCCNDHLFPTLDNFFRDNLEPLHANTNIPGLYSHSEIRNLIPPNFPKHHAPKCLLSSTPTFDPQFLACLRSQRGKPETSTVPVIMDTGCSFAITYCPSDFLGEPIYQDWGTISTANGSAKITALGIAEWTVMLTNGQRFPLRVPCHLVPDCNHRLLSPQDYCRYHHMPTSLPQFGGDSAQMWLNLLGSPAPLSCSMDPRSLLPIFLAEPRTSNLCACKSCHTCFVTGTFNVLGTHNTNLTAAQKALLFDHHRLGHVNMAHLQRLYTPFAIDETTTLKSSQQGEPCLRALPRKISTCPPPLCTACQIAKSRRQPSGAKTTTDNAPRRQIINTNQLVPGQLISVDHYESSVRGRLPNTRGRESEHRQYVGGMIFYDHASGRISVHHQPTLGGTDTIRSKFKYEQDCRRYGIEIQKYHADNGVFTSEAFLQDLESERQTINLAGVGAHHQNPYAERAIQTITYMARTMLIHAKICWPDEFDIKLWPFALDYACWIHNHLPNKYTGLAPEEIFSGSRLNCTYLRRARVWGCPAYVLQPKLQDGRKIPKWEPRARLGQFVGVSPMHSSVVKLIRNVETDYISPQFHIVFDEKFTTVDSRQTLNPLETWVDLFTTSREHVFGEDEDADLNALPELDPDYLPFEDRPNPVAQDPAPNLMPIHHLEELNNLPTPNHDEHDQPMNQGEPPGEDYYLQRNDFLDPDSDDDTVRTDTPPDDPLLENAPDNNNQVDIIHENEGRPTRHRRPNPHVIGPDWINIASRTFVGLQQKLCPSVQGLMAINWTTEPTDVMARTFWSMSRNATDPYTGEVYYEHPLALSARAADADSPTLNDILHKMDDDERDLWLDAMDKEVMELVHKQTFHVVPRSDAGIREIVPSTWVFKRKRKPDGEISKLKARFCVRGDRQRETGQTMAETFAPVVDWGTLRTLFALTIQFNLHSQQIDFKNAFVQSSLPEPIYLELPPGGYRNNPELKDKILKVKKSLYGDRRAPKLWYEHCRSILTSEKYGFQTNDHLDPCLFLRPNCAIVLYVDDAIIVGKDKQSVDSIISQLEQDNLDLTREGDIAAYLGVKVDRTQSGDWHLYQPGLTNRIIQALGLTESRTKQTPAVEPLGKCALDPSSSGTFNYRSVIGMMMYLGNNTRPDCSFAIHQCARFSIDPRVPHEQAVKRIGRYLSGTKDRGLIMKKSDHFGVDCYVDASFAGDWGHFHKNDPSCAKSRTGYVITVGNMPVVWSSKMQTEIALSTMEAEYIALSTAMRALLPMRRIQQSFCEAFCIPQTAQSSVSIVWEDNQAAKILASNDPPRMTPRSKHIAIKYHWFRSHLKQGAIEIKYIETSQQKADILTKPLQRQKFQTARQLLMGW